MKNFCTNCGKGVEYASIRPNFCPACGNAFGGGSRPVVASVKAASVESYSSYEEEPDELAVSPEDISISQLSTSKPIQMQEVFGSGSTGFGSRRKVPEKDVKSFMKKMASKEIKPVEISG